MNAIFSFEIKGIPDEGYQDIKYITLLKKLAVKK